MPNPGRMERESEKPTLRVSYLRQLNLLHVM